jgi:transposase-like protein
MSDKSVFISRAEMEVPTPRTDAVEGIHPDDPIDQACELAGLARQLERELNALRTAIRKGRQFGGGAMESETPRTDAASYPVVCSLVPGAEKGLLGRHEVVPASFARQLERELAESESCYRGACMKIQELTR